MRYLNLVSVTAEPTENDINVKLESRDDIKEESEQIDESLTSESHESAEEYDVGLIKNESEAEVECIEMEYSEDDNQSTMPRKVVRNRKVSRVYFHSFLPLLMANILDDAKC